MKDEWTMMKDEWRMMKDDDFKLFRGFEDRLTDETQFTFIKILLINFISFFVPKVIRIVFYPYKQISQGEKLKNGLQPFYLGDTL